MSYNQQEFLNHYSNVDWDERHETPNLLQSSRNLPYMNMNLFEMSPLYSGCRKVQGEGGGFLVESFAIDSELKEVLSDNELVLDARFGSRNNDGISQRFSISDVMGISGAAMGWALQGTPGKFEEDVAASDRKINQFVNKLLSPEIDIPFNVFGDKPGTVKQSDGGVSDFETTWIEDWTCPAMVHWQPQAHQQKRKITRSESQVSRFADGGFMDNLGLMPLLARKVSKIILCMNSDYSIRESENDVPGGKLQPNVEHLFGVVNKVFGSTGYASRGRNHVFSNDNGECDELLSSLQENRETDSVSWHRATYTVVENANYGIEPYEVEIFWHFTEKSEESDNVIDELWDNYDDIEGHEVTPGELDGFLATILRSTDLLFTDQSIHGIGNQFSAATVAANSIFSEPWDHIDLEDVAVKLGLDDDMLETVSAMMENTGFPHYNTHCRLSLSAEEVGLLANYTNWCFLEIEDDLRDFFEGKGITDPVGDVVIKRKSAPINDKVTLNRRVKVGSEVSKRKESRILRRKSSRIEDREYYGDDDFEILEEESFEEKSRSDTAMNSGKVSRGSNDIKYTGFAEFGRRSSPDGSSETINLENAIANQEYSMDISNMAEDPDEDDIMSFSKISGPAWLTVDSDGQIWGKPSSSDVGTNRFKFRVSDLEGESADAEIVIEVESGNRPPRWKANLS